MLYTNLLFVSFIYAPEKFNIIFSHFGRTIGCLSPSKKHLNFCDKKLACKIKLVKKNNHHITIISEVSKPDHEGKLVPTCDVTFLVPWDKPIEYVVDSRLTLKIHVTKH